MEYPRLYIVNVATRAHERLSTVMNRMENRLGLQHRRRDNYHRSLDEFEAEWEWVE